MEQDTKDPRIPLTLTEQLAAERTSLANERTLMAYCRTALSLIVSGTGFSQYLDSYWLRVLFFCFIPVGLTVLVVGLARYRQRRHVLRWYQNRQP